jgi:hypothetical protein
VAVTEGASVSVIVDCDGWIVLVVVVGDTVGLVETLIVGTVTTCVGSVAPGSTIVGSIMAYVGTGWLVGGVSPSLLSVGETVGMIAVGSLVPSSLPIIVGKGAGG